MKGLKKSICEFSHSATPYGALLCTAIGTSMIACNQTLSIMLTHQLCTYLEMEKEELAINLEDTAVVVAPLVPWSIASAVPLTSIGAPQSSILMAFFLYLLPIYRLALTMLRRKSKERWITAERQQ